MAENEQVIEPKAEDSLDENQNSLVEENARECSEGQVDRNFWISLAVGSLFVGIAGIVLSVFVPKLDEAIESKTLTILIGEATWKIEGKEAIARVSAEAGSVLEEERSRVRRTVLSEFHSGIDHAYENAIDRIPYFLDEYNSLTGWLIRVSGPLVVDFEDDVLDLTVDQFVSSTDMAGRLRAVLERSAGETLERQVVGATERIDTRLSQILRSDPAASRSETGRKPDIEMGDVLAAVLESSRADHEDLMASLHRTSGNSAAAAGVALAPRVLGRSSLAKRGGAQALRAIGRAAPRIGMRAGTAAGVSSLGGPVLGGAVGLGVLVVGTASEGYFIYEQQQIRAAALEDELEWALLADREATRCLLLEGVTEMLDSSLERWAGHVDENTRVQARGDEFRIFGT